MKAFFSKYKYLLIGILVLFVIFFVVKSCFKPDATPDSTAYHAIEIPLYPQKGSTACWAATISMLDDEENYSKNNFLTSPIFSDSLLNLLQDNDRKTQLKRIPLQKSSDISWDKLKKVLLKNDPLVAYKYFNIEPDHKNAHVFLVKGFQEIKEAKWIIVNDPWPINTGKITAIAFNNFTKPKIDALNYSPVEYNYTSNDLDKKTEPDFSIFSTENIGDIKTTNYLPDLVPFKLKSKQRIKAKNVEFLFTRQLNSLKNADPELFEKMGIDYRPQLDELTLDLSSFVNLKEFQTVVNFLKYTKKSAKYDDYKFDGDHLAFVNANKNQEPDICLTVQLEEKTTNPYLYISRFESYKYSFKKDLDWIANDVGIALTNSSIRNFLFNVANLISLNINDLKFDSNTMSNRPLNAGFSFPEFEESNSKLENGEIYDFAMLPLYGGPVYSFSMEGFDEKIVADPYRQLNYRMNKKVLFMGASGTPYYRLSSIIIPKNNQIVDRNRPILEEWRINNSNLKDSTNYLSPNQLPINIVDGRENQSKEIESIGNNSNNDGVGSAPNTVANEGTSIETEINKGSINTNPEIDISKPTNILSKLFAPRGVLKVLDQEVIYDGKIIKVKLNPIAKETISETAIRRSIKVSLGQIGERIYGKNEEVKRRLKLVINSVPIEVETEKGSPILKEAKQGINKLLDRFKPTKEPK